MLSFSPPRSGFTRWVTPSVKEKPIWRGAERHTIRVVRVVAVGVAVVVHIAEVVGGARIRRPKPPVAGTHAHQRN